MSLIMCICIVKIKMIYLDNTSFSLLSEQNRPDNDCFELLLEQK
jgi:hypothetical protein